MFRAQFRVPLCRTDDLFAWMAGGTLTLGGEPEGVILTVKRVLSCGVPPDRHVGTNARLAEQLGFDRLWLNDNPPINADVWMSLAVAAGSTSRIGLGPAVLVPSLRHPIANAAAIATLEALAPGRVAVAVGTGFTGRILLGHRPLTWEVTARYVAALRGLLLGEVVEWEGKSIQMVHPLNVVADRPIKVPLLMAAMGPKGIGIARSIGDGVFSAGQAVPDFDWSVVSVSGTVLGRGERLSAPRVVDAVGPSLVVRYHLAFELGGEAAVIKLPSGERWLERVLAIPSVERHLRVHEDHFHPVTDLDRELVTPDAIDLLTFTGSAAVLRRRLSQLYEDGATEVTYRAAGSDVERELRAFMVMAKSRIQF